MNTGVAASHLVFSVMGQGGHFQPFCLPRDQGGDGLSHRAPRVAGLSGTAGIRMITGCPLCPPLSHRFLYGIG